jgi:polysaccharide biosynthesis protein PslH
MEPVFQQAFSGSYRPQVMTILFLCNKSPYPAREGGPMAMNMMIEGVANAGHRVKVLAVNSEKYHVDPSSVPESYILKTGIEFISLDLRIKPIPAFINLFTSKSYHIRRFSSDDFKLRLKQILEQERFDIVQFEMLHMSPYLETVRNYSGAKTILRAHNVEHIIWERITKNTLNPFKKAYLRHLSRTLKEYETSVINDFDGIVAITETDANAFRTMAGSSLENCRRIPPDQVISIPFGVDLSKYTTSKNDPGFPSLFSIGSMDWGPNIEGIAWFLEQVWPLIHRKIPALKYYIAGRHMPEWLKEKQYPNVMIVGEVPDSQEFMKSRTIMIVPLLSGSGIRVKIIEGMATGKPILSTTVGAEGINCTHGKDIFIADNPSDFTNILVKLTASQDLCKTVGENARNLIENEYDQNKLIGKLIGFYKHTLHRS